MRCNICDKSLGDKELTWNEELQAWEICTECLDIALETAFPRGIQDEVLDDEMFILDEDFDSYDDSKDYIRGHYKGDDYYADE